MRAGSAPAEHEILPSRKRSERLIIRRPRRDVGYERSVDGEQRPNPGGGPWCPAGVVCGMRAGRAPGGELLYYWRHLPAAFVIADAPVPDWASIPPPIPGRSYNVPERLLDALTPVSDDPPR